jgi:hypothetical protein
VVRPDRHAALAALIVASGALAAVRLVAATRVGFGDSEALYASYALHPQPAYVDHPGLIGDIARAIGGGTAPSPPRAHVVTTALATALPWLLAVTCRACGATWPRAFAAALVFALVPEIAIGTFAMTPDLPLAFAWLGALAGAAAALRAPPGSALAAIAFGAAGVLAGAAAMSKVSGCVLLAALAIAYVSPAARPHRWTLAPWVGLASGAILLSPVVLFEAHSGWPMLRHRLIETQGGAGVSLRNAAALVGGQLAYLSPPVVVLAALGARRLWRDRADPVGSLLLATCAAPGAALVALCLWSRVAEPHWIAPALLGLAPALARGAAAVPRRLVVVSAATAGALVAAVHAWVLVPGITRLAPGTSDARLDLSNELYGWPEVIAAVREEVQRARDPAGPGDDVAVVGPHWVVCAQLEAALRGEAPVGCDTPVPDDFDRWWPRERWRAAETLVWVTDARFGAPPRLPEHALLRTRDVRVMRDGRLVREFTVAVMTRRAAA